MSINLDEIEKALGEITQGDWELWEEHTEDRGTRYGVKCLGFGRVNFPAFCSEKENAHLIANAPEWLRLLVERVRKLEQELAWRCNSSATSGTCEFRRK